MPDFTPLPPPPGGHSDARARGRRRRTRRSLATGGALLSVVAAVALTLPLGRSSAIDRLVPLPAASSTDGPSASEPTASPSPSPSPFPPSAPAGTPVQPTSRSTTAPPPSAGAGAGEAPEPTFDRVVRSYTPPDERFTLCSPNASVGGGQSETSLGWCHTVEVTEVGARYRLSVVVCRSSDRTAADLHPDLVPVRMRVARQDVDVWTLTVAPTPRETLPTAPGGCWRWSTDWDARADDGRPVRTGGYELLGAAMADELPGGDQRTTFNASEP